MSSVSDENSNGRYEAEATHSDRCTRMRKHTHRRCATFLWAAKGKCSCRIYVPYDGSVLAIVPFDDEDLHDGNPTLSACTGPSAVV